MENQEKATETFQYRVYDEMGCEHLLFTNDLKEAQDKAYNHQCILLDNLTNKVLKDYSC
ncbi:hypothetical protein AAKU52_002587 [Pedobacter sp. CG_S7]|uniref:hypothetical protein n=1 Tax=Pedobacter sp. CG_S7 TaxID=3143930 RepID=UPI0033923D59